MESVMRAITPCLWFDTQAEEAAEFYVSVFGGRVGDVEYYGENMPMPAGTVLTVEFELRGQPYLALNGGPVFKFNEAVSLQVFCKDQAEVDRLWERLTANGGQESQCGWLKDRFGFSWQIIPEEFPELLKSRDKAAVQRAMQAMMTMRKLDLARLKAAFAG
jgi:predicted 3-demethylubiquinone-9 3-methyltransferase (glyoxalase superfamily)